jgi:putative hydrolase of the HAD superfamily
MIRTILFDFGNVLAFFDHSRALEKLKHHTTIPPAELALILYGGELELAYECGQIRTPKYFEIGKEDGRLTCSLPEFIAAFVDIFTENVGVTRLIAQLKKNHRLVLASNTNEAHFTHYREQFRHFLDLFDHLVVSHEVGARKPHRAFYEQCQKYANCEPGECLFVDDLPSNIHAAEAFGWNGIILTTPEDLIARMRRMRALGVIV